MGKIPFSLSTGSGIVVSANGTASYSWNVGSGELFEGFKLMISATSPNFRIKFRDSNGNYYSTDYIDGNTIARIDGVYISLPFRMQLTPNMTLSADLADYSGAQNTIHITIIGYKELGYIPAPNRKVV
ncbi:MAG: hypothetical protein K6T16_01550 [Candidatus Pacearchaeota archaeon]|nr:hypothetical protein [Candidatus Pacearchaeota archaeon]